MNNSTHDNRYPSLFESSGTPSRLSTNLPQDESTDFRNIAYGAPWSEDQDSALKETKRNVEIDSSFHTPLSNEHPLYKYLQKRFSFRRPKKPIRNISIDSISNTPISNEPPAYEELYSLSRPKSPKRNVDVDSSSHTPISNDDPAYEYLQTLFSLSRPTITSSLLPEPGNPARATERDAVLGSPVQRYYPWVQRVITGLLCILEPPLEKGKKRIQWTCVSLTLSPVSADFRTLFIT